MILLCFAVRSLQRTYDVLARAVVYRPFGANYAADGVTCADIRIS